MSKCKICFDRFKNYTSSFISFGITVSAFVGIYYLADYLIQNESATSQITPTESSTTTYLRTAIVPSSTTQKQITKSVITTIMTTIPTAIITTIFPLPLTTIPPLPVTTIPPSAVTTLPVTTLPVTTLPVTTIPVTTLPVTQSPVTTILPTPEQPTTTLLR